MITAILFEGQISRYFHAAESQQKIRLGQKKSQKKNPALVFSLICAWNHCGVNNRDAGDLRRHLPHYDVIVILRLIFLSVRFTENKSFWD